MFQFKSSNSVMRGCVHAGKDVERLNCGFEDYSNDDVRSPFLQSYDICHVVARHMPYDWMIYVMRFYDGCHCIYEKAFLHKEIQVLTLRHIYSVNSISFHI